MASTGKILDEFSIAIYSTALTARDQRKFSKIGFLFSSLPAEEQILVWDQVWKSSDTSWYKIYAFLYERIKKE